MLRILFEMLGTMFIGFMVGGLVFTYHFNYQLEYLCVDTEKAGAFEKLKDYRPIPSAMDGQVCFSVIKPSK